MRRVYQSGLVLTAFVTLACTKLQSLQSEGQEVPISSNESADHYLRVEPLVPTEPSALLNRAQAAYLVIQKFREKANWNRPSIEPDDFRDLGTLSPDVARSIKIMRADGITSGCRILNDGRDFCPEQPMPLWQFITLLTRAKLLYEKIELPVSEHWLTSGEPIGQEHFEAFTGSVTGQFHLWQLSMRRLWVDASDLKVEKLNRILTRQKADELLSSYTQGPSTLLLNAPSAPRTDGGSCQHFRGAASLKYFGPYCSSCQWVGSGSYTYDTRRFSNLTWIGGDLQFTLRELELARASRMRAVVSALNLDMTEEYFNSQVAPQLKAYVDAGVLVGFYMADDYIPNLPETERQIRLIKRHFPNVAAIAILVNELSHYPGSLDWIGFEPYFAAQRLFGRNDLANYEALSEPELATRRASLEIEFRNLMERTASRLESHQKLLLVPGYFLYGRGFYGSHDNPISISPRLADHFISPVLKVATNNPRVIGVVPFLWQSEYDGSEHLIGAKDIAGFREHLEAVGQCFYK